MTPQDGQSRGELRAWAELVACIVRVERIADSEGADLRMWVGMLRDIESLMVHEALS
jgi:hypothetical protein